MKAIIPVAGHGTRLEPHTLSVQKCLLPVAGKPVLAHIIEKLSNVGIQNITLIIGHLGDQVIEFCKTYKNISFNFVKQTHRLGLGHAIFQGLEESSEPILILLGDAILEFDYNKLIKSNNSMIGVKPVPDPHRFGIVETLGDKIIKFYEKPDDPPTNMAITGVYLIKSEIKLYQAINYLIKNNLRSKNEYQLTDALEYMLSKSHLFKAFEIDDCLDCGITETILSTNKILLNRYGDNIIDKSAKIINSTLKNCTISKDCYIENSSLDNVIILNGISIINKSLVDRIISK